MNKMSMVGIYLVITKRASKRVLCLEVYLVLHGLFKVCDALMLDTTTYVGYPYPSFILF